MMSDSPRYEKSPIMSRKFSPERCASNFKIEYNPITLFHWEIHLTWIDLKKVILVEEMTNAQKLKNAFVGFQV